MKDSSSFDTETGNSNLSAHQTRKNTDTQLMISQAIEYLESVQETGKEKAIELYAKYKQMPKKTSSVVKRYTVPLLCWDNIEGDFKHSFLLSKHCPINLMGRDFIVLLGIVLISTPQGIVVTRISKQHLFSNIVKRTCFMPTNGKS